MVVQFIWPTTTALPSPAPYTLIVYEGADWCLEELQNPAGTVERSWSYELLDVEQTGDGGICRTILPRGRDWVGSCLLRTLEVPCQILKMDEKGIWMRLGGWERLQWHAADRVAAEAWCSVRDAVPVAAASNKPTSRHMSVAGRSRCSKGLQQTPAAGGDAVCRIRLPATAH